MRQRREGRGKVAQHERRLRFEIDRLMLCALITPGLLVGCTGGGHDAVAEAGADARVYEHDASMDAGADCGPSKPYANDAEALELGDADCFYFVDFPCGAPPPNFARGCYLSGADCVKICTVGAVECQYLPGRGCTDGSITTTADETVTVACGLCASLGRRPAGLGRSRARHTGALIDRYFAQASHLEAASVYAFERLGNELRTHGAPAELVRAARRSARDEVRHARAMATLAARGGAQVPRVSVKSMRTRPLERVAIENAVEGCVRETFGAAVAVWQARHAHDPEVRKALGRIAVEETRHAALAWAVDAWAGEQLGGAARARVTRAKTRAVVRLLAEVKVPRHPVLVREAGLPDAKRATTLVRGLFGSRA